MPPDSSFLFTVHIGQAICLVAYVWLAVLAFREGIGWGAAFLAATLLCSCNVSFAWAGASLSVPIVAIVLAFRYPPAWCLLLLYVVGLAIIYSGLSTLRPPATAPQPIPVAPQPGATYQDDAGVLQ